MIAIEDLYIMDVAEFTKDLYRMGNATWPAFTEDRARRDITIVVKDGIETVVANGNGFSAFDHLTKCNGKAGQEGLEDQKRRSNTTRTEVSKRSKART